MQVCKLFDAEFRLMEIIWQSEPVNSTELVKLCQKQLGWKKSTTYTMVRKLCERGVLCSAEAVITARVKREQVQRYEGQALLDKAFDGSLPAFIATFIKDKPLSAKEAQELKKLIEEASQ